mmetsp:Transcript_12354/g.29010  ORF Transcript_12354/g.29010 Transcript_12354/m.29010 type:complete len:589 (+) Transcript_12354:237-2003(+)|eukprot:CAMPEP_0178392308 /NCGR_PEP_ID=MMETSP0689_2-20121128/11613_1 /TAXON_ID=160604 /ORGANISM="Amphidinium massartii, Strain CS-259" /LENGTH=588 /DNA_ID=CAMNT_0020012881 /DNA_START=138 /DNA_END=1904 /DNA_ORIENTATION=-
MEVRTSLSRSHTQESVGSNDSSKRPASSKSVFGLVKGDLVTEHLSPQEELDHVAYQVLKLKSKDPEIRRRSADSLAIYVADQRCLPEVVRPHPAEILADALTPKDNRLIAKPIILSCARSLCLMGSHAAGYAAAALAQYIKHNDEEVRWEVVHALGAMGSRAAKESAEGLAGALSEDESPLVRWEAAKSIRKMGGAAAVAKVALTAALSDTDPDIHNECAKGLGGLKHLAADEAAEKLAQAVLKGPFELRRRAAKALGHLGPGAADAAAHSLGQAFAPTTFHEGAGSDATLRRLCVEALSRMGVEVVTRHARQLATAVMDPDEEVAALAQGALREAYCVRALGGTMELFDPDPADVDFFSGGLSPPSSAALGRENSKQRARFQEGSAASGSEPGSPTLSRRKASSVSETSESSAADGIDLLTTAPSNVDSKAEAQAYASRLAARKAGRHAAHAYCRAAFARFVVLDMRAPRTYRRFLYERISRWIVPKELRQLTRGDIVRFVDVADFQMCADAKGSPGPVQRTAFTKRRDGMRQVVILTAPQGAQYVEVESIQGETWLKGWVKAFGAKGESLLEKVPPAEVWQSASNG